MEGDDLAMVRGESEQGVALSQCIPHTRLED